MDVTILFGHVIEIEKKKNLFANLPEEIEREILRRLPIESVIRCKYVCTSWRDIIKGVEFATLYFPKPSLALSSYQVNGAIITPSFTFRTLPSLYENSFNVRCGVVIDSVDGLILVKDKCPTLLYVCNPITREYIELPFQSTWQGVFGFGVSKLSRQYKILYWNSRFKSCYVCTLGEESWRSIFEAAPGMPILNYEIAAFFNGNLHWLASDEKKNKFICCFDLETELFASFSLPPRVYGTNILRAYRLCVLEGQLCLCDTYDRNNFVIWLMKNYGDGNSWVKEYTFDQFRSVWQQSHDLHPLKVLTNGDLLFHFNNLFIYSRETKTVVPLPCDHVIHFIDPYINVATYTPTFRSLKDMGIHNVRSMELLCPFVF